MNAEIPYRIVDPFTLIPFICCLLSLSVFMAACSPNDSDDTTRVRFEINGTSVRLNIPEGFSVVNEPATLKEFPFPEDQKLYFVMVPINNQKRRHIAVGSKPYLDRHNIGKRNFDLVKHGIVNEMNESDSLGSDITRMKPLIDKWRSNKGMPGIKSAKVVGSKVLDNAIMLVAVVLNEDGSEFVNCTRMQHHKNRIVVMAVASPYEDDRDIEWVFSTAEKLDKVIN